MSQGNRGRVPAPKKAFFFVWQDEGWWTWELRVSEQDVIAMAPFRVSDKLECVAGIERLKARIDGADIFYEDDIGS